MRLSAVFTTAARGAKLAARASQPPARLAAVALAALLAVPLFAPRTSAAGPPYRLTVLPSATQARDLSSDGRIVGRVDRNSGYQAFYWDRTVGLRQLAADVPDSSIALSVNSSGTVLGMISGGYRRWIWDAPHGRRSLDDVRVHDSATDGWQLDVPHINSPLINDAGVIVGTGILNYVKRAYIAFYKRSTGQIDRIVNLGVPPGGALDDVCWGVAISPTGDVVGALGGGWSGSAFGFMLRPLPDSPDDADSYPEYFQATPAGGDENALMQRVPETVNVFLAGDGSERFAWFVNPAGEAAVPWNGGVDPGTFWQATGAGVDWTRLPGKPEGMSDSGWVCGRSGFGSAGYAFLKKPDLPAFSLGHLVSGPSWCGSRDSSAARAINSTHRVVGGSATKVARDGSVMNWNAFVWDEATGMRNLNGLIAKTSATLMNATHINDRGQIVGTASAGNWAVYLLDPQP